MKLRVVLTACASAIIWSLWPPASALADALPSLPVIPVQSVETVLGILLAGGLFVLIVSGVSLVLLLRMARDRGQTPPETGGQSLGTEEAGERRGPES